MDPRKIKIKSELNGRGCAELGMLYFFLYPLYLKSQSKIAAELKKGKALYEFNCARVYKGRTRQKNKLAPFHNCSLRVYFCFDH